MDTDLAVVTGSNNNGGRNRGCWFWGEKNDATPGGSRLEGMRYYSRQLQQQEEQRDEQPQPQPQFGVGVVGGGEEDLDDGREKKTHNHGGTSEKYKKQLTKGDTRDCESIWDGVSSGEHSKHFAKEDDKGVPLEYNAAQYNFRRHPPPCRDYQDQGFELPVIGNFDGTKEDIGGRRPPPTTTTPPPQADDGTEMGVTNQKPWPPDKPPFVDPGSQIVLILTVVLKPERHGLGGSLLTIVADIVTESVPWLNVFVPASPLQQQQQQQQPKDDAPAGTRKVSPGDVNMWLGKANVGVQVEGETVWWWQHNITFDCYWSLTDLPVTDVAVLRNVTRYSTEALSEASESGFLMERVRDAAGRASGILDVLVDFDIANDEDSSAPESGFRNNKDGPQTIRIRPPPTAAPTSPYATFPKPLDTDLWNWRRYLGLALFLGTISISMLLGQVAAHRQRRRAAVQAWGNLATAEGVDELLQTGWKLRTSSSSPGKDHRQDDDDDDNYDDEDHHHHHHHRQVLEVYKKEGKLGYRDDDSLFIGGYEQREALAAMVADTGTVTHETEASPDTDTYHTPTTNTTTGSSQQRHH